ncbi:MAG: Hpt domain-containing protein [Desulfovibrionaceae bacterium]
MNNQDIAFDPQILLLSLDNDQELLEDLLSAYVEDAPVRLDTLGQAVSRGDMNAAMGAAHSLKGMSGVIRVNGLERLALELELIAKNGDMEQLRTQYAAFERVMTRILHQAREYLQHI